jgi:hypothetical protein
LIKAGGEFRLKQQEGSTLLGNTRYQNQTGKAKGGLDGIRDAGLCRQV